MNDFTYTHGNLTCEQVPIDQVAREIGTPCYIYSHEALCRQYTSFDQAFDDHPHQIHYAVKANSNLAVLNSLAQLGSGFDIVSGGELDRVLAAKGSPKKVVFSGVGKQPYEMEKALKHGIFCFNVESESELDLLNQIAAHLNVSAPIALRVNPDIDPNSHPYISTGLRETKFGIDIDRAFDIYQTAAKFSHLSIKGVACHIGSQLTTLDPFLEAFKRLSGFVQELRSSGFAITHIDVGGGLGVRYGSESPPEPYEYVKALCNSFPKDLPVLIEPGRAIAANAGILVTQVLYLKQSGEKRFCVVDGAMNDLIRPALYSAWHDIVPLKQTQGSSFNYDIVGPICESGDFLGKDRSLNVQVGDFLAILSAGAYGFVKSSNFNTRPRSAEVMIKNGEYKVIRMRETVEQLLAPERLW